MSPSNSYIFFIADRVIDFINIKSFLKSKLKRNKNESHDLKHQAERHTKFINNLLNNGGNQKDIM